MRLRALLLAAVIATPLHAGQGGTAPLYKDARAPIDARVCRILSSALSTLLLAVFRPLVRLALAVEPVPGELTLVVG